MIQFCIECGGDVCICHDDFTDAWAAHCMHCDNSIGKRGYYHPVTSTKEEAIEMWNKLNEPKG